MIHVASISTSTIYSYGSLGSVMAANSLSISTSLMVWLVGVEIWLQLLFMFIVHPYKLCNVSPVARLGALMTLGWHPCTLEVCICCEYEDCTGAESIEDTALCCWMFVRSYTRRAFYDRWPVHSWMSFSGTPLSYNCCSSSSQTMIGFVPLIPACSHIKWNFFCNVSLPTGTAAYHGALGSEGTTCKGQR